MVTCVLPKVPEAQRLKNLPIAVFVVRFDDVMNALSDFLDNEAKHEKDENP